MVTPFNKNGKIDFPALQRLTTHLINGGADYLVVQGTTGESPVLQSEEKRALLDFILEVNAGKKPIVYGIGGNNTQAVIDDLERLDSTGIDGILSVSPAYNKPSQQGIYEHYKALSSHTDLPIILYNVPGRTGSNVLAQTTLRIAQDCPNVIGVKEASGNLDQIAEIISSSSDDFLVLSGDDILALTSIALGADGVISVVGNAFPTEFGQMVHQALFGQITEARTIHYQLRELIHLVFKEGNPSGIKEVLKHLGICESYCRLPLVPVSPETSQQLYRQMADHELVKV